MAAVLKIANDIESTIDDCIKKSNGDAKTAITLLSERLTSDHELLSQILTPQKIRNLARNEIRYFTDTKKHDVFEKEPVIKCPAIPQGIMAVANRNWLEYPLFAGLKLADAGSEQLLTASTMHAKQSAQHGMRSRLFRSMAEKLRIGETVKDKFSHADIQLLSIRS